MATITKRAARQWQAKVRKRGYPTESKTFETKARAENRARMVESEMDLAMLRRYTHLKAEDLAKKLRTAPDAARRSRSG